MVTLYTVLMLAGKWAGLGVGGGWLAVATPATSASPGAAPGAATPVRVVARMPAWDQAVGAGGVAPVIAARAPERGGGGGGGGGGDAGDAGEDRDLLFTRPAPPAPPAPPQRAAGQRAGAGGPINVNRFIQVDGDLLSRTLVVSVENGVTVEVDRRGDRLVSVKVDGREVPIERVRLEGERLTVLDERGEVVLERTLPRGAGVPNRAWANRALPLPAEGWAEPAPTAMLGVTLASPTPELAGNLKVDPTTTAMVLEVKPGQPAEKAGLQRFDIIVRVDGREPADEATIRRVIREKKPGDTLELQVLRGGERLTLKAELAPFRAEALAPGQALDGVIQEFIGPEAWGRQGQILIDPAAGLDLPQLAQRLLEGNRMQLDLRLRGMAGEVPGWPGMPADAVTRRLQAQMQELSARLEALEQLLQRLAPGGALPDARVPTAPPPAPPPAPSPTPGDGTPSP